MLASYGFLILVFQDGHGAALLHLAPPGGLNAFIVLVLFTILFGLSMDYEVFLLSSIRDEYLRTGNSRQAVAHGIARTGGVITSAAAIMISLFLAFGCTRLIVTRELGLGLAFAVAFDATLVRLVLLPALMALIGRANWWLAAPARRARGVAPMSREPWAAVAELARLAPTPHNTQPFRIRPLNASVAQLVILKERMLPVEDTDDLYVLSSFGIFAETLERAGRHFGLEIRVTPDARRGAGCDRARHGPRGARTRRGDRSLCFRGAAHAPRGAAHLAPAVRGSPRRAAGAGRVRADRGRGRASLRVIRGSRRSCGTSCGATSRRCSRTT